MKNIRKIKVKAIISKFRNSQIRFVELGNSIFDFKQRNRTIKKCIKLKLKNALN